MGERQREDAKKGRRPPDDNKKVGKGGGGHEMGMASGDDREEALSTGAPSPAHQRRPTHPPLARKVGCRMDDG